MMTNKQAIEFLGALASDIRAERVGMSYRYPESIRESWKDETQEALLDIAKWIADASDYIQALEEIALEEHPIEDMHFGEEGRDD